MSEKPFFVGYLKPPAELRGFLMAVSVALIILFAAVGYVIGTTQADPGPGAFRFDYGRQVVLGRMDSRPYPMLHITSGTDKLPAGETILLSGGGKNGVQARADGLDGKIVQITGPALERGDLHMIQVLPGRRGVQSMMGELPQIVQEDLGRWRLAGEICDGKCLAGAMRPGTGLAHRACANLCLVGGVPPVFVSSQAVEGSEFLVIAGPDGGPMPDAMRDLTALFISIEGRIERRGSLLVFLIDPETAEVL